MALPDSKALADFFMSGRSARYSRGEVILAGDDKNPEVHFVGKGFVKVYSIDDDGEEYIHVIYGQGDIFPLIWILKDLRRHVFYEAIASSVLWKVPKETFLSYLKQNTNDVTYAFIRRMAEQFNIYADRLDNLQYKSAYERVVYRLLFLAGRFGIKNGNSVTIDAPITHKMMAESINLARESVSRELERLVDKGLIGNKDGKIVIKNIQRLGREFSEPVSLDLWGLQ